MTLVSVFDLLEIALNVLGLVTILMVPAACIALAFLLSPSRASGVDRLRGIVHQMRHRSDRR